MPDARIMTFGYTCSEPIEEVFSASKIKSTAELLLKEIDRVRDSILVSTFGSDFGSPCSPVNHPFRIPNVRSCSLPMISGVSS